MHFAMWSPGKYIWHVSSPLATWLVPLSAKGIMKYLLGERLHFDWKVITITIVSTLLLMVDHYHQFTASKYWDRFILYLIIPLVIIFLLFRENPREFGFSFGDWKAGLIITAIGILFMAPI